MDPASRAQGPLPAPVEPEPAPARPPSGARAWLPLTPRGVAAFSGASALRLLVMELVAAAVVVITFLIGLVTLVLPVVREAARHLPEQGVIFRQELMLPEVPRRPLAAGRILAVTVEGEAGPGHDASTDFLLVLDRHEMRFCSMLGCLVVPYPRDWTVSLNPAEVGAWLEAWTPPGLFLTGLCLIGVLLAVWRLLALIYTPIPWLLAYYSDRALGWEGSRRLARAALMPGALVMTTGMILYMTATIDLLRLLLLLPLHLVVGWVYLVWAPRCVAPIPGSPTAARNPFHKGIREGATANPFARNENDASEE